MKTLDRKLLRELMHSKGLLAAIAAIMAIGIMCYVYMSSAYHNLRIAQERYYAQGRMADFWIDVKKAPLAGVRPLAELAGVTEIRTRIGFLATVDLDRIKKPLNGLVLSLPDRREPVVNDIVLRRGSYFSDRRRNEVIVNDAFARKHRLAPGHRIHLLMNNRREELFIVGTAISCEFVYLVSPGSITPDPEHFGVFYLKQSYAEDVYDFNGATNQIVGRLAPEIRDNPEAFLRRAEAMLQPYGVAAATLRKDQVSNRFVSDEIRGLGVFATILPGVFLAVAALVLNILLSRMVDQQRVVIGTLKAIGYSDWQVVWHFVKYAASIGLVASVVGCAAGYAMAALVTRIYQQFFEFPDLTNRVFPSVYATGVVISIVCSLIGSLHGARSALRLRPAEAMRPKPPARGGAVWLQSVTWLWRRLSFPWRMVLRDILRNRVRTAIGAFAAAMGSALLLAGLIMAEASRYLIDFQFDKVLRSDVDLTFDDVQSRDALLEAQRLPGVARAEPLLHVACTLRHGRRERKGGITGLVQNSQLTIPRDGVGNRIEIPEAGVVMTRKMAELLDVQVGDVVEMRPTRGLRHLRQVPVIALADSYLGMAIYADIRYLSRLVGESYAMTGVQLETVAAEHAEAVRMENELFAQLKQSPALQSVQLRADVIRNLRSTLVDMNDIFITLLMFFAGVIFFGSVLNASLVSLAERRREVATLRVLGYGPWQIGGMFYRESLTVNTFGTLLGLPIGYALAWTVSVVYDTEMFRFPIISPPAVWIKTVVVAVLFSTVAHLVVQWSIHRDDYLEALGAKE